MTETITAYHEAGHAVMAYQFGATIESIDIGRDPAGPGDRYGAATIVWHFDWQRSKEGRQKAAMVALAGPAAEMIHSQEPYHPGLIAEWAEDWRQAWEAYAPLVPDDRKRLAALEQVTVDVFGHLYSDEHWAGLAALADEIEAHQMLEWPEIQETLSQWLGIPRQR